MGHRPLFVTVMTAVLFMGACGVRGDGEPTEFTNQAPETTASAGAGNDQTTASTAPGGSDSAEGETGADGESDTGSETDGASDGDESTTGDSQADGGGEAIDTRPDLLTFARGALFVTQTGLSSGSSGSALRIVDGDPLILTVSNDGREPTTLVYSLPALTTFDRFAIPGIVDRPGNVTFFRDLLIEGSDQGPDDGFVTLVDTELTIPDEPDSLTELIPDQAVAVRWLRVTLANGIVIGEGEEGRTNLDFTELIGTGSQDDQPTSTAFDGVWDLRLTERLDVSGDPLELRQSGATIVGCLGDIDIQGSVNGSIATATGVDSVTGQPAAFVFVENADGVVQAAVSIRGSIFAARTAVDTGDPLETRCSGESAAPVACGSTVYVNFDLDSAVIRPESDQVLADLFGQLTEESATMVSVEGHTSTEGSDAYNLDLSQRRARAVVDDIVARGFDSSAIAAAGFGETSPLISPDDDETSRAINRRVEIVCG